MVEGLEKLIGTPPEVLEAERVENACEWVSGREEPCRTSRTVEITAATTSHLSVSWNSYGDCGSPGGNGNAAVYELTQVPKVIGLEGQAFSGVSIWDIVDASDRSRIESEAVAAVGDFADYCCCRYRPEVLPRSWKIVHRSGRWRPYPRLFPDSGPYCYEGWFESAVEPHIILRTEPVAALVPSASPFEIDSGVPRPQPDVVCSPDAAMCLQVLDAGLVAHVLEPEVSATSRRLLEFSALQKPPRIVSAAWAVGQQVALWDGPLTERRPHLEKR